MKESCRKWVDQYLITYNFPKVGYCRRKPGFFEKNGLSMTDGDGVKHLNNRFAMEFRGCSNSQIKKNYHQSSKAMRL